MAAARPGGFADRERRYRRAAALLACFFTHGCTGCLCSKGIGGGGGTGKWPWKPGGSGESLRDGGLRGRVAQAEKPWPPWGGDTGGGTGGGGGARGGGAIADFMKLGGGCGG